MRLWVYRNYLEVTYTLKDVNILIKGELYVGMLSYIISISTSMVLYRYVLGLEEELIFQLCI